MFLKNQDSISLSKLLSTYPQFFANPSPPGIRLNATEERGFAEDFDVPQQLLKGRGIGHRRQSKRLSDICFTLRVGDLEISFQVKCTLKAQV